MAEELKVQDPSEFFQSIGSKVEGFAPTTNGEAEEDFKPVDEIESLCMNCHENVSSVTYVLSYFRILTAQRA